MSIKKAEDQKEEVNDIGLSDKKRSTKEKFRLRSHCVFLTYSRCPSYWTAEFVVKKLVNEILVSKRGKDKYKTKVKAWIISRENHKEAIGQGNYERGIHFHCLLECEKKLDIKKSTELDIEDEKAIKVHGNYQAVRDVFAVINYVKKFGDWIGEGFPGMDAKQRAILNASSLMDAKLMLMDKMTPHEQLKVREEYRKQGNENVKVELEEIRRVKVEMPFRFKRDLEPYIAQLMGRNKGGFNLAGRPMGIVLYGKSGVGKSTWRKDLERILKEKVRCVNSFRAIADRYEKETIIVLDEFKGSDFKKYSKELKLMITEDQCETLPYRKVVDLVWPRRIMICTNEDIENWEWVEGMRERFLIIELKGPEDYQLKLWRENLFGIWILEDKTLEETMEYLGFEIKEVQEMTKEELSSLKILA